VQVALARRDSCGGVRSVALMNNTVEAARVGANLAEGAAGAAGLIEAILRDGGFQQGSRVVAGV
jgi:ribosomal protein L18